MLRVVSGVLGALLAGAALAAQQPSFAPPPAWVKPIEVSTPAIGESGPSLRFLLEDRQLNFGPDGQSEYVRQVAQIRTTTGLAEAGSVSLGWNPAVQSLTIHHLRILRGGKTIDVLASQSFNVLQREAGLESSILDGALTATIQPEGLEVGDVLELAYTMTSADPIMYGRAEHVLPGPDGTRDRYRLRATWDTARPIAWRPGRSLPKPTISKVGGQTQLVVELKDVEALEGTANAPPRYAPSRDLWFSDFPAWADVAAALAPLYERAAKLSPTSPLRAEVARIRAQSDDPKVRAAEALRLVEDRVRYLALMMSHGALDPADADVTWQRRFGDCKGKTALLIALLHELDIPAEPVLVSTVHGDGLDAQLPSVGAFDHVLVRVVIAGRTYWLDGTRVGDRSLDSLTPPPYRWALPVQARGATLIAIAQPPLDRPDLDIFLEVDATAGVDAPARARGWLDIGGDEAIGTALGLANLSAGEKDKMLRNFWSGAGWIEVKSVRAERDEASGRLRILMEGTARPGWQIRQDGPRVLEIGEAAVAFENAFEREGGSDADAPYVVDDHPSYFALKLVMKLPHGGEGFTVEGEDLDEKVAGRRLTRRARIDGGVLTVELQNRTLVTEFPAAEAAAANARMEKLAATKVMAHAPRAYAATEADIAAWLATEPTTVDGFLDRAYRLAQVRRFDAAVADYDKALKLDPKSANLLSNRGIAYYWLGQYDKAKADFDAASGIDPRNWVAFHGHALLALREGRYEDAVAALTRASDLYPNNTFALARRADAYAQLGQFEKALADLGDVVRLEPRDLEVRGRRIDLLHFQGRDDQARAELDEAVAKWPSEAGLRLLRGAFLAQTGRRADADRDFAAAIGLHPTAEAHLTRARNRERADYTGLLADLAEAEKLAPKDIQPIAMRAGVFTRQERHADAIDELTRALKLEPDNLDLLAVRGTAFVRNGEPDRAARDFAVVRERGRDDAHRLNEVCWSQAIANFALDRALADCQAALALDPKSAATLDSRAFVLLRQGKFRESIADYNEALKLRPKQAASLYGRGLARIGLGLGAEGEADLAAARAVAPGVADDFAGWGLRPPAAPAKTVAATP